MLNCYVQRKACVQSQGPEEFFGKGGIKSADLLVFNRSIKVKIGSIGYINCNLGQGLIHWNSAEAVTADTTQVSQGRLECLP